MLWQRMSPTLALKAAMLTTSVKKLEADVAFCWKDGQKLTRVHAWLQLGIKPLANARAKYL